MKSAKPGGKQNVANVGARLSAAVGAPDGYGEVRQYFATVTERARALGVQRHTVRKWDGAEASRLRQESQDRVRLLLVTARSVQQWIGDPVAAGRWLLTEQPVLRGVAPTDLLLRFGDRAQAVVQQLATGVTPVREEDVPSPEAFWRALEGKLAVDDAAEVRSSVERARERGVRGALSL